MKRVYSITRTERVFLAADSVEEAAGMARAAFDERLTSEQIQAQELAGISGYLPEIISIAAERR